MTPEQQRIAIAQACGWKVAESTYHKGLWSLFDPSGKQRGGSWFEPHQAWAHKVRGNPKIPAYLSDLNACAEFERVLTGNAKDAYINYLVMHSISHGDSHVLFSTSAQRCEAFLRVRHLWTENLPND